MLKYSWRRTFKEYAGDYVGFDITVRDQSGAPLRLGRISRTDTAKGVQWSWSLEGPTSLLEQVQRAGLAATEREAAKAVEDAYEELRAYNSTRL